MLGKKLDPSAEVAAMEALKETQEGIETVTRMCADFYHALRGKGLPDEVAFGLTNTWLGSMMGSSVTSHLLAQAQELGEEGEDDE